MPDAVIAEIGRKGPHDATVQAIRRRRAGSPSCLPRKSRSLVRSCNLDQGETAVLAVAHGDPDAEVGSMTWRPGAAPPGWGSRTSAQSASSLGRSNSGRSRPPGP